MLRRDLLKGALAAAAAGILPLAVMYFTGSAWMLGAFFVTGWLFTGTMPLVMSTVPAESVDSRHMAGALGVCMGAGELIGGVLAPSLAGIAWVRTSKRRASIVRARPRSKDQGDASTRSCAARKKGGPPAAATLMSAARSDKPGEISSERARTS